MRPCSRISGSISGGATPARILEIGPKDGKDTLRLLGLGPEALVLIDLPRMQATNEAWLRELDDPRYRRAAPRQLRA